MVILGHGFKYMYLSMCEGQINNVTIWGKKSRFVDFDHVYLFKGKSAEQYVCKLIVWKLHQDP